MDSRIAAFLHYYAREGYGHHVQAVCNEVLKAASSPVLLFWRAYGLLASGSLTEAMRELYAVQGDPEVGLAATAALVNAHQLAKAVDFDAVHHLAAYLEAEERSMSGVAALHLAEYLFYVHSFERCRAILERQLDHADAWQDLSPERAKALLGFVLLEQQAQEVPELQDAQELQRALHLFDTVLQRDPQDLEAASNRPALLVAVQQALLGKTRALEATGKSRAAWELLSEAFVQLPWAVPVANELARLTLAQQDWEGLSQVLSRLQQIDSHSVMAMVYTALMSMLIDGNSNAATQHLADMAGALLQYEPYNAQLMLQLASSLARLAGGNAAQLAITLGLAERALLLQPDNMQCVVEVATQHLLLNDSAAAIQGFEAALRVDELNMRAALGLIEAHLAAGQLDEAAQQLTFLPELLAASKASGALTADHMAASASRQKFGFGAKWCDMAWTPAAAMRRTSGTVADDCSSSSMQLVAGVVSEVERVHQEQPQLLYLKGMLAWKQGHQDGLHQLQQYMELQLTAVEDVPYGLAMFAKLHASRVMGLLCILLDSVDSDPRQPSDPPSPMLSHCIKMLEMLSRYTHNHPEAQLLSARALYLNGALDAALCTASDILRCNGDSLQAALLVVSTHVRQGRPVEAMVALEAVVSANFTMREAPLYHMVHAQVLVANSRLEEAKKVLEAALALPGVRSASSAEQAARLAKKGCLLSLHERASIYLLLIEVIGKLNKGQDSAQAKQYLAEAVREFAGTREEVRVMVADCEAAIESGDVTGALQQLRRVPESSPQYMRARMAMGEIYLKHKRDQAAYIQCFLDLVDKDRDYNSYCLLGEAFLAIHQPHRAANAYESALSVRPKDSDLALTAAQALVAAHSYNTAVDYFNRAIWNDPTKLVLQHGLARLLLRLGQTRQATALLGKCLEAHKSRGVGGGSLEALALDVDTWLLLARLEQQNGNVEGFAAAQNQALSLQLSLLEQLTDSRQTTPAGGASGAGAPAARSRTKSCPPSDGIAVFSASMASVGTLSSSKIKAASICFELAEFHRKHRQFDKAEASYSACLTHQEQHGAARLALARLALANGQVEACQSHAAALLQDQPDNEDAAIMLAELMAHQGNHESAVYYFQQLLEKKPCHYTALVQLLGLLRRAGKLADACQFITAAEAAAAGGLAAGTRAMAATISPAIAGGAAEGGLQYCHGLLQRYRNNPRQALKHFNAARSDLKWSSPALLAMAEIYLNPESAISWASEGNESDVQAAVTAEDNQEAHEAVKAASMLLQQMRPVDMQSNKYKVLSAYTLMASKARPDIEAAVGQLLDMANTDPNNVPVLMALAHGFLLLKQTAKARNQLKRVAKLPYKPEEADEFERAWLALADIHIAAGKFDLSQELCNRCLKYNKSCSKAWELLGSIAEREQAYKDAASSYEHAWKLAAEANSALGYKLAFNHMKAGRLVDAVSVAQAVLKVDHQYPKIKQDVLDKAWLGMKP